jgi:sugar lactone lactonase YvrE
MTDHRRNGALAAAVVAAIAMSAGTSAARAEDGPNAAPNPYSTEEGWAKLSEGRKWGMTIGIEIARDGKSIWVFDRCGAKTCAGSPLKPIQKFDAAGNLLASFGADMFVFPHGFFVDSGDNLWVTDGQGKDGKGHVVVKFSPDGKVLMTLGKPGVAGDGNDVFNAPSDVLVAPNGDIFVGDGHGGATNARVMKFSADGKFIKTWGKKGTAAGEFSYPHGLAMDSAGRLFVADRENNRIQIFDQDGKYIAEWKQFGRPSGVFIDKNDVLYVADSQSSEKTNPGFQQGIRIGSAKDGKVTAFIPETKELGALEGVAADSQGIIYGGYTNLMNLRRFVKVSTTGSK